MKRLRLLSAVFVLIAQIGSSSTMKCNKDISPNFRHW